MVVLLNGKKAVIKKGTSFDFVSENRLFTEAEEYSFNIEMPIEGCEQNINIFGLVNIHTDVTKFEPMDMEIIDGMNHFKGTGIVNSITDKLAKVQFVGGKSAENYNQDLNKIYIDSLELGRMPWQMYEAKNVTPLEAWQGFDNVMLRAVALPWKDLKTEEMMNAVGYSEVAERTGKYQGVDAEQNAPGGFYWHYDMIKDFTKYMIHTGGSALEKMITLNTLKLSWMPSLMMITEKICEAIGWTFDFNQWRQSKYSRLAITNVLPPNTHGEWQKILPHWTVKEYFTQLGYLIEGVFDFDMVNNKVSFRSYNSQLQREEIFIDNVLDEFSSEIFDKNDQCNLISMRNIKYSTFGDTGLDKYLDCTDTIEKVASNKKNVYTYETALDLANEAKNKKWDIYDGSFHRYPTKQALNYIADIDRYATLRYVYVTEGWITMFDQEKLGYSKDEVWAGGVTEGRLQMVNQFGGLINKPTEKDESVSYDLELKFVPACIDYYSEEYLYKSVIVKYDKIEGDSYVDDELYNLDDNTSTRFRSASTDQHDSFFTQQLDKSEEEGVAFSYISVAFIPENITGFMRYTKNVPCPIVDYFDFGRAFAPLLKDRQYTLSLQRNTGKFLQVPKVVASRSYEFKFLANKLPDVYSVFVIRGKRFICESLTAQFTDEGMSQLIKGKFWAIDES